MMSIAVWMLALGCGAGQEHPSRLTSLQTVGIVATPPEVTPGEFVQVDLAIADPAGEGAEIVLASCIRFENRCAEEVLANPSQWLSVAELPAGETSLRIDRTVPPDADEVFAVAGLSTVPFALVALACAPGLCPIIEEAPEALEADEIPTELAVDIAQPERCMIDLPVEGVSLTGKGMLLSEVRSGGENQNPTIEARFLERDAPVIEIPLDSDQEFAFYVRDDSDNRVYAYAYTTLGRFETRRERVRDSAVRHYLLATERGEGHVTIVFEDEEGGSAVWQRPIRIQ